MASGPETRFIKSIHRLLSSTYFEKMNNPFRSGTPDVWYSGKKGDLWVEYKFTENLPRSNAIMPDVSARQDRWLTHRLNEGRNVAVVLGTKDGAILYRDREWAVPLDEKTLTMRLLSKQELARWIFAQVGEGYADTSSANRDDSRKGRKRKLQNNSDDHSRFLSD